MKNEQAEIFESKDKIAPEQSEEIPKETTPLLESVKSSSSIGYCYAFKEVLRVAGPFCLSRFLIGTIPFTNGIILSKLGSAEIASGPLITSFMNVIMGTARGMFQSTGIIVSNLNGAAKEYADSGNRDKEAEELAKIGDTVRQSWIFSTIVMLPAGAILLNTQRILVFTGIQAFTAEIAQDFFTPYVLGILPMFLLMHDQQFALGLKKPLIPLVTNAFYVLLTPLTGYILSCGLFGLPKLGMKGLGLSTAITAWITFFLLRGYYLRIVFKPYNLFKCNLKGTLPQLIELIKIGAPTGLQVITEWISLATITVVIGRFGQFALTAEQISLQYTSAYISIAFGIAQGTAVVVSESLGKYRKAIQEKDYDTSILHQKNSKIYGNAGIFLGLAAAVVPCILFMTIPRQLSSVFINVEKESHETLVLAQAMLFVNGIRLIIDSGRIATVGALRGYKDVIIPAVLSFIGVSVIGLACGFGSIFLLREGPNSLFITQDIGIILAAIGIALRWIRNSIPQTRDVQEVIKQENVRKTKFFAKPSHGKIKDGVSQEKKSVEIITETNVKSSSEEKLVIN